MGQVEMPLTALESGILLQFALVRLLHGFSSPDFPPAKLVPRLHLSNEAGPRSAKKCLGAQMKELVSNGLQVPNMYGPATETGEHKFPMLQAGGPSSSPSGLNRPEAKYIVAHIGDWWGGFYPIGRQVSHWGSS